MSAVFKNAKKKLSQAELRKFMNEHKKQQKVTQKIDSPLAKYTDSGQLMCVLCKSLVRSEAVWTVHINAKQHKENVLAAKKLSEVIKNPSKRPLTPEPEESAKRPKGILKNSTSSFSTSNGINVTDYRGINIVPDDFFDNSESKKKVEVGEKITEIPIKAKSKNEEAMEVDPKNLVQESELPEGFFDDPKLDAKARNLEYKNPVEEEWEKFQKEIKAMNNKSAEIIAEDQEEATAERQIDEIEEQMRNWSRVLQMEKKKEEVKITTTNIQKMEIKDEDSGEDDDFDEFLDWRSKKS